MTNRKQRVRSIPLSTINKELKKLVAEAINNYQKELEIDLTDTLDGISADFERNLRDVTPVSKGDGGAEGHLRDNITRDKKTEKGRTYFEVNFGKKSWLSGLLEFGVRYSKKGLVKYPFVRPLWARKKEEYRQKILEAARGKK